MYAAYKAAFEHKGQPTVILARTIKGYGLGEAGEGKNITHQQKKLNEDELRTFRNRFDIDLSDDELARSPFFRPNDDSPEMRYLQERRKALGGYLPARIVTAPALKPNLEPIFEEFYGGTGDRKVSTTMVFVKMLAKMLRDKDDGQAGRSNRARTRRARSAWSRCSARSASTRTRASSMSRSTWTRCSTTRK